MKKWTKILLWTLLIFAIIIIAFRIYIYVNLYYYHKKFNEVKASNNIKIIEKEWGKPDGICYYQNGNQIVFMYKKSSIGAECTFFFNKKDSILVKKNIENY
jgi:hypothetical protein